METPPVTGPGRIAGISPTVTVNPVFASGTGVDTFFSKNKTRMTSKIDKYKPHEMGGPLIRLISIPQVRILEACKHIYNYIRTTKNPKIDISNAYIMEQVYKIGTSIGIYKIHHLLNANLSCINISTTNLDPLLCLAIQHWHTLNITESAENMRDGCN